MQKALLFGFLGLCCMTAATGVACGSVQPSQARESQTEGIVASPDQVDSIVRSLAVTLRNRYLDATIGQRYHDQLLVHLAAGRYNALSASELAKRLTADLQSVEKDGHLGVTLDASAPKGPVPPQTAHMPGSHPTERNRTYEYSDEMTANLRVSNFGIKGLRILPGNVGLLELAYFTPFTKDVPARYAAAFELLRDTDALVIDVNEVTGGDPLSVTYLVSHLLDRDPFLMYTLHRRGEANGEFWSFDIDGAQYGEARPVFVATSSKTISAGEGFAYEMKSLKRAQLVGETTAGAANPGGPVPVGYGFSVFVPEARVENAITKSNWEGVGVVPDISTPADQATKVAHRLALESVMKSSTEASTRARAGRALAKLPK